MVNRLPNTCLRWRTNTPALSSITASEKAWSMPPIGCLTESGRSELEASLLCSGIGSLELIDLSTGFAGSIVPDYPPKLEVTVSLIPSDTNVEETVTLYVVLCVVPSSLARTDHPSSTALQSARSPYASVRVSPTPFSNQTSFWANLCTARDWTNGVDRKLWLGGLSASSDNTTSSTRKDHTAIQNHPSLREVAALPDLNYQKVAIDLPEPFVPAPSDVTGNNDVTYFTMLPNSSIGVMVIGSFYPQSYREWEQQLVDGIMSLQQTADHLIIDVTNNPGGYVCAQILGEWSGSYGGIRIGSLIRGTAAQDPCWTVGRSKPRL